jgi:hypothetical protein
MSSINNFHRRLSVFEMIRKGFEMENVESFARRCVWMAKVVKISFESYDAFVFFLFIDIESLFMKVLSLSTRANEQPLQPPSSS